MKRIIRTMLTLLILLLLSVLLFGCNSSSHTHKWGSWYDNGDGTHMRMCLIDSEHTEYAPHVFSDYEITKEPTDIFPGEQKRVCSLCGYTEKTVIPPAGDHVFDQEIADERFLYSVESSYCSVYYKSCKCGAFGNPDYLFEKSLLPDGYSNLKYIKGNGTQYIDTGIENDGNYSITYNSNINVSVLPEGYQEVEYIESTGTQYINTGLPTRDGYSYDITYMYTSLNEDDVDILGASGLAGDEYIHSIMINYCGNTNRCVINDVFSYSAGPVAGTLYNSKISFVGSSFTHYINGELAHNSTIVPYENPEPLSLFARFCLGEAGCLSKARIYSYKVYNNGLIIQDMVPCYDINNGVIGFYDLASKTFYTNSGAGEFIAGDDVLDELPSSYQKVEYIESTGTQYIDTGLPTKDGYSYDITYMYTNLTDDVDILSATGKEGERYIQSVLINYCYKANRTIVNDQQTLSAPPEAGRVYNSVMSFDGTDFTHYIDGVLAHKSVIVPYTNIRNLYLFARNSVDRATSFSKARVYYYKVYDHGRLIQDMVPCINKETKEAGLYDVVNNKFYKSCSGENFIAGDSGNSLSDCNSDFSYFDGSYFNTVTDEATSFDLEIQTFCGDDFEKLLYKEELTAGSEFSYKIDRTVFSPNSTTLRVKCNGKVRDINIGYFPIDIGCDYTFSMYVCSADPSTLGGIILNNVYFAASGGEAEENLPDGYILCEYIQSTGPQAINTGYIPNSDTGIEIRYKPNSTENDGCFIFGAGGTDYNDNAYELYPWNNKLQVNYGSQSFFKNDISADITTLIIKDKTALFLEGNSGLYAFTGDTNPSSAMYLFALNRTGGTVYSNSGNRIYFCKIYEKDALVRNYVPCIRKSDGYAGMYDTVENKFYGNAGAGEFIPGPALELPTSAKTINIGFNYKERIPVYDYSRISDANVYKDDKIIMQLIPALRNSDSAVGMYDLLNNKFYETTSTSQFLSGGVIGHALDNGKIVKAATYQEDGEICYTCSICGAKIYDKMAKLSYKVSFNADEGVKAVRIYFEPSPEKYETGLVAYSRNHASYNYSKTGAVVMFRVELNEGYRLELYDYDDNNVLISEFADYSIISGLTKDMEIIIKTAREQS